MLTVFPIFLASTPATLGVVPVLVGPLQILITLLPAILLALATSIFAMLKPSAIKTFIKLMWRQRVVVCVTALAVTGAMYGIAHLRAHFAPPPAEAVQGDDWPTARGSLLRRGHIPGAPDPARKGIVWSHQDGIEGFYASPAVVGNRVYISSARLGLREFGRIYCFDADSGAIVWKFEGNGYRPTFSSPVVSGNFLVCGEGLHTTRDARIICLDARTGQELWSFRTSSHVECTPVIADGKVYVGAGDDGYYCLALEPAEPGKAQVIWHLPGEKYPDAETSLAVHEGKVYAGLGFGGKALCVLDADTGEEEARIELTYPAFSPPAIAGGKLYIGTGDGDYVKVGNRGEVRCIDLKTLKTDWTFEPGNAVLGAIAIAGDRLFFGCQDMHLYALDMSGKLAGKWNAQAAINGAPAVGDNRVYVITRTGTLAAIHRQSMNFIWGVKLKAEDDSLFIGSPVVARGHVYVGTDTGFFCIGRPAMGSEDAAAIWPGRLGGPGVTGNIDDSTLPRTPHVTWSFPPAANIKPGESPVQAPPAMLTSRRLEATGALLFVPMAEGAHKGVVCLSALEGKSPKLEWSRRSPRGVFQSPVAGDGRVYFADGSRGGEGRSLHCVEAETGAPRWTRPINADASGTMMLTRAGVLIQDGADTLSLIAPDGTPTWTQRVGHLPHPPAAYGSILVCAASEPAQAIALDLPTGQPLWRVALPAPPTTGPYVDQQSFILGTENGLAMRSILDGQQRTDWIHGNGGGAVSDFHVTADHITYIHATGWLVFLSRETGQVVWSQQGAMPGTVPLVSRSDVIFLGEGSLLRLGLDGIKHNRGDTIKVSGAVNKKWLDYTTLGGKPTSPMIVVDGAVYLGIEGRGLVRVESAQ